MIDHTLLAATAQPSQIEALCDEAREHGLFSVCVNPLFVPLAANRLRDSGVAVCTVVGFPLGANRSVIKAEETRTAVADGATEIDMVIPVGLMLAGEVDRVEDDIARVVEAAGDVLVKVIFETGHLSPEQIDEACRRSESAGAKYVKTSTGMGPRGASVEDIRRMHAAVGGRLGVKASGGVRDAAAARAMIEAGATRIGASASIKILEGWE